MKLVIEPLLGIYLGLAPIFWLPGISIELLGDLKMALFFMCTLLVIIAALPGSKLGFPKGVLGPLGLVLNLSAIAGGLIQSDTAYTIIAVKDYLLVFSALWIFFLIGRMRINAELIFVIASSIVAFACLIVAIGKYAGGPDFAPPPQLKAEHLWTSGFGGLRTGWSNGVALYVAPLLLAFGRRNRPYDILLKILASAAIGCIVLSQFAVAGRAGLVAAALLIAVAFNQPGKRIFLVILATAGIAFIAANLSEFAEHMRITRDETRTRGADDLNTISAGRLQGDLIGLQKVAENPLLGAGMGNASIGHDEIHNLWIRLAAESGLFTPLMLMAVVYKILRVTLSNYKLSKGNAEHRFSTNIYFGAILAGLSITMLEPRMLIGSFQVSLMWWAFAGLGVYRHSVLAKRSVKPPRISVARNAQVVK